MATLTTQVIRRSGVTVTYASAAGGGDKFTPTDRTWIEVVNGGGSPITVTVTTPNDIATDISIADVSVSVTNGTTGRIGPFPPGLFQGTDGLASISYSGVTSVTVAALQLGT